MPQINKIMNITCKFLNLVSNIIFTVTVICTSLVAEEVPSTKNGITISAIADGTNAENSQILCTVINQSAYPLVSANRGTECHAFLTQD